MGLLWYGASLVPLWRLFRAPLGLFGGSLAPLGGIFGASLGPLWRLFGAPLGLCGALVSLFGASLGLWGPTLGRHGPNLSGSSHTGRTPANTGRIRPTARRNHGPVWAVPVTLEANLVEIWLLSARIWSNFADSDPSLVDEGRPRPEGLRLGPELGRIRPNFGTHSGV